ncbi:MAG: tetratricopeptide repeat protein [bacterium]
MIAALLFALHPVQTEAVTYISGRSTSLMAMFYLGSIIAYIYGTETNRGAWLYLLSPALFMMAVLSKETGVTLPLALLLWTSIQNQKNWGVVLRMQIVYWAMFICILIVLIAHPNYGTLLEYSFDIRSLKDNLLSQINGVIYLISRLFMINRLNIDPDLPVQSTWTFLLAVKLAMLLALILTGMISLKRIPWLGFALLWFFLHLLPTNSVVPRLDVANERQLYLPVWGIFLGLSIGMVRFQTAFKGGKGFVQAVTLILLVILGYFTAARNYTYRSEIALWEDTVRKSPQKARVYNNLGYAYAIAGRNEEAKRAYLTALSLDPDYSLARNNLARISGLNP